MTDGLKKRDRQGEKMASTNFDRPVSVLVCTVTGCVGVTACLCVCRLRGLSRTWRGQ